MPKRERERERERRRRRRKKGVIYLPGRTVSKVNSFRSASYFLLECISYVFFFISMDKVLDDSQCDDGAGFLSM